MKQTEFVAGQKFFDEGDGFYVIVKSVSEDKVIYDGYNNYQLVQPEYSYTLEQFTKWINRKKDSPARKAARRLIVNHTNFLTTEPKSIYYEEACAIMGSDFINDAIEPLK